MIRRPPISTLFPTRRSSDLVQQHEQHRDAVDPEVVVDVEALDPAPEFDELHRARRDVEDRKSTRLNSSHQIISYAVFCLKKKNFHHEHIHMSKRLHHYSIDT